ncbi:MAG TPA: outer membrane beta-barrel protein [Luteibacter sp.]|uniref:outer membrane protein n=1 Tax=Luteibacter sp. TaxID=1886636 RepID=UPI002F424D76
MQKTFLAAAAAATFFLAALPAAAATQQGAFISVNGGRSHYDVNHLTTNFNDMDDRAFGALAGYRWVVDRPFAIGVEAGYVNLGRFTAGQGHNSYRFEDKVKSEAVLIGANGKWDLPHGFTITAHTGLAHSRAKLDEEYVSYTYAISGYYETTTHYRQTSNDNGIYAGIGFGYDFNENFGITATYDNYSLKAEDITGDKRTANVGVFGGALEYRF